MKNDLTKRSSALNVMHQDKLTVESEYEILV